MKQVDGKIILKPSFVNVIIPRFLRHTFWNGLFFLVLYVIYFVLDNIFKLGYNVEVILSLIFLTILFSIVKIAKDLFDIMTTSYIFHNHSVERKFSFIREKSHSVNYNHITDIHVKKSVWDTICNVGDIIIHTSSDHQHDGGAALILNDVKYPDKLKEELQKLVFNTHQVQ